MLPELDDYSWKEVFAYAGEPGEGSPNIQSVPPHCLTDIFTREDVEEIYGIRAGENDERQWLIYGRLKDHRYFYLDAGCCYTGWDCQASGSVFVSATRDGIIRNGLTSEARIIFGIAEDNIGNIEIKENTANGFTSIIKDKKREKETVIEKKRPNNPILSLEI